jgi:hypothetical protein
LITASDIPDLAEKAERALHEHLSKGNDRERFAVDAALMELLAEIDVPTLRSVFLDNTKPLETQRARITLLSHALWNYECSESLALSAELLLAGETSAAVSILFIGKYGNGRDELSWACFQTAHIERLLAGITDVDHGRWSLDALQLICAMRPDRAAESRRRGEQFEGIARGCLIRAIDPTDMAPIFGALKNLCSVSPEERHNEPFHLLDGLELDWHGYKTLFVDLLRLRDMSLARALLEGLMHEGSIGAIEIGPIEWWLDWLADDSEPEAQRWFADRLCRAFDHLSVGAREAFVAEFNRAGSRHRPVLARFVLWRWRDLTTDDFSEEALSFLIADLARRQKGVDIRDRHLLGHTATEAFVTDRLVPLLDTQDPVFHRTLVRVLEQAGSRHERRYVAQ